MKGSVSKRPSRAGRARWAYWFDLGKDEYGRRKRVSKSGFETKREAEEAMANAISEHRDRPAEKGEKPMPTFAQFAERWLQQGNPREWSLKTLERAMELLAYAVRAFGDVPLDQLTQEGLRLAMNALGDYGGRATKQFPKGKPLAAKTCRHIAFLIQACLEQAVDWDYIAKNPMRKVKKPRVPRRRPRVVDRSGFDALLKAAAGMSIYPVIVLGMASGMRRGEMLGLEWSDLDWDRGTLEVSKSLEQTKHGLRVKSTKSGETRRFAIPAKVLDVLREHKREQDEHRAIFGLGYANKNLVFARPDGEYYSPDKLGTRVRAAMQRAGLTGVSLHSLRHSHASELLSKGAPITAVSERLGHASPNITLSIYSHALPSDNEAAAKLWNDAMADVLEASRKELLARKCGMAANGNKGSGKIRVIPIQSAS
jgi:integrase